MHPQALCYPLSICICFAAGREPVLEGLTGVIASPYAAELRSNTSFTGVQVSYCFVI